MMRIVFAGTPSFSVPCLQALLEHPEMDVVGVISQPDRKSGRGMKLTPSPVKQASLHACVDVITPETLRENQEALHWLNEKKADFLVVVAFGMILPKEVLQAVTIAPINVHASLLPRWRGAAPIERALLAGDKQTGVCIMHMEEGLDTGGIYACESITISPATTASELWSALAPLGAELLVKTLPNIASGLSYTPQDEQGMTYAKKLTNDERMIDWQADASAIDSVVRCFTPKPGARAFLHGKGLKVIAGEVLQDVSQKPVGEVVGIKHGLDVVCGNQSVYRITELQPEGKRAMQAVDFLRGSTLDIGASLLL